jgi:hypothetical protein
VTRPGRDERAIGIGVRTMAGWLAERLQANGTA